MTRWQERIIDSNKLKLDERGIYVGNDFYTEDVSVSKAAWERIHNFDLEELILYRKKFDRDKLQDHIKHIERSYRFSPETIYLEIGCGPSHIGEYLMSKYNCKFIGMDFNYNILVTLKKYLDSRGYKDFVLIHTDINQMPIKDSSVSFIYGGGVIEHFSDTARILRESYRVLNEGGVSFNTVPALTLWWFLQFYYTIPDLIFIRRLFEFIHIRVLNSKLLLSNSGYQLGFTKRKLVHLHTEVGFKEVKCGVFPVNISYEKSKNKVVRKIYYFLQKFPLTSSVYYVIAKKSSTKL